MADKQQEKIKDYPEYRERKSALCKVSAWWDIHGAAVLRIAVEVPAFDSGDRMYDDRHALCLLHDGRQVSGIYCTLGYQAA